jgi:hypothetical protein
MADETKLGPDETISSGGEDNRKLALATSPSNETTGREGPRQGTVMIKAFSAIAAAAFIAAALTVLPGFAPQVEASVPEAAAGDRLERAAGKDCSQQSWPNFEASCLRTTGSKSMVREVRLVTADRTP